MFLSNFPGDGCLVKQGETGGRNETWGLPWLELGGWQSTYMTEVPVVRTGGGILFQKQRLVSWTNSELFPNITSSFSWWYLYNCLGNIHFYFFPWTYFLVLISLSVQHEASSFDTCHFDNEAGKKQVVLLDARSHLFPSWQPLLRWVYLQVQLLSSPKLHVWNKNVFRSEVWLTLFEGQLCIWHEGWRGLPPSTQTTRDISQQGAVPSPGEEALSLAHS